MKVVIIGGTAGGAGLAARLRRLDEKVEITIIEKNPYISWAGCALPYFAGGVIADKDTLFLATKEMFKSRYNIDVMDATRAVGLDREQKCVLVDDAALPTKNPQKVPYDRLVIATGAKAIVPAFAQRRNADGIFTMRSIEDADGIRKYIKQHNVQNAVIVGGGFIGLEACENLQSLGINITLVEKAPQVLTPVDPDIAKYLHLELEKHGVCLKLGVGITNILRVEEGEELSVELENGEVVKTQLVIMSLGIAPESDFLQATGVELNARGYVVTDDTMQTSDPNIFALGDVVAVKDVPTGRYGTMALAGPATKQARVLAHNILLPENADLLHDEHSHHYHGSLGVSIVRVMRLTAGAVGANTRALQAQGYDQSKIGVALVHTPNHVSWFTAPTPVHLKLLFDKESGAILGAQAVGEQSVDKNLEAISALMQMHGTVYDMVEFESAYAPPFSAPRSPVNMAGSTAANVVDGMEDTVTCAGLSEMDAENTVFWDVRTPAEVAAGEIPQFVNVPLDTLREYVKEHPLDESKNYVVTCQVGVRGHIACCILRALGAKKVYNLTGGYQSWAVHSAKLQSEQK